MTSVYCAVEEGLEGGAYYGSCTKEDLKVVFHLTKQGMLI